MTQQPFSRPGAIDLSALKRPAQPPASSAPGGTPSSSGVAHSAYSLDVTEENFQQVIESSMAAPVLLVFFSRTKMPESGHLAEDMATVSGEFEGRYLVGLVDIDAVPQIAQAMQIQSIPLVVAVVDGRPMPLFQDVVPIEELRTALTQVGQQLTTQGVTGRHQPRGVAPVEGEEEQVDPRYAAAQDALGEGDIDLAVAEYQKLVDANPADTEATAGLSMAKVLQRTQGADLNAARAAAAAAPDDVDAQTMVADLDLLGGHVEDAFARLVALVARTADADRTRARDHLLGLFAAVGNDDERVLAGRRNLASALF
ncbi:tetratricopeptide repeat protein [Nocardioides sp.]|uniref:co-chaperone YbbN n=1 Tax=Nocardioides sp. TaxID=35761 RepID=UPI00286E375D|nr:tetratricopeptide repeat protein [Nocardioides sp.]